MRAHDVIGWAADAALYCHGCARRRYGPDRDGRQDDEGNEVHAVFPGDAEEGTCDDCGEELAG